MLHRRRRESPHFIAVWSLVLGTWRRVEPRQGSTSELPSCESESAPEGKGHPLLLLVPRVWITAPVYLRARLCVCVCLRYGLADSLVLPVSDWHTWRQSYAPSRRIMWCPRNRQNKTTTKTRKPLFKCLKVVRTCGVDGVVSHRAHDWKPKATMGWAERENLT